MEALRELCDLIAQNPSQFFDKIALICNRCPPSESLLSGSPRISRSQLKAVLVTARFISKCGNYNDTRPRTIVLEFIRAIPASFDQSFWPKWFGNASIASFYAEFFGYVCKATALHPDFDSDVAKFMGDIVFAAVNDRCDDVGISKAFLSALSESFPPIISSDANKLVSSLLDGLEFALPSSSSPKGITGSNSSSQSSPVSVSNVAASSSSSGGIDDANSKALVTNGGNSSAWTGMGTPTASDRRGVAYFEEELVENLEKQEIAFKLIGHILDRAQIDPKLLERVHVITKDHLKSISDFLKIRKRDWTKQGSLLKARIVTDTPSIPIEPPFRHPSGVVIHEPSLQPTSCPIPVSQPPPSSQPTDQHKQGFSLANFSLSELSDAFYARLLSISSPNQQERDLMSLLRNFQPPPTTFEASISNLEAMVESLSTELVHLSTELVHFRSKVCSDLSDIKHEISLMTAALSSLTNRIATFEETCQVVALSSHKRRHDQDDLDHQGHEGENAKRQRVEETIQGETVVSADQETVVVEETVRDKEADDSHVIDKANEVETERLKQAHPELIFEELLNEAIPDSMASQFNSENVNNFRMVIYVDPHSTPVSVEVSEEPQPEDYEDMRNFFANLTEIDYDDDDDIVISDSEVEVGVDDKDLEDVELLYGDLSDNACTQSPAPESTIPDTSVPESSAHPISPVIQETQATIDDSLDFRRTLRRLEVLIGKNRQRTLFERH